MRVSHLEAAEHNFEPCVFLMNKTLSYSRWVGSTLSARIFVRYCRSGNHPCKLRIIHALARFFFSDGVPLKSDNGAFIKILADDFIGWKLIKDGAYEPETLSRSAELLGPGGSS